MSDAHDQISDKNVADQLRREQAELDRRRAVDRLIEEAVEKGAFDNLPGRGKPLNLKKNPYAPEQSLAYELLQNNDYTLPWIAERNEMLASIEDYRATLLQEWERSQRLFQVAGSAAQRHTLQQEWKAFLRQKEAELLEINKAINALNLLIPASRLEVFKLSLERELQRAGARQDLP